MKSENMKPRHSILTHETEIGWNNLEISGAASFAFHELVFGRDPKTSFSSSHV